MWCCTEAHLHRYASESALRKSPGQSANRRANRARRCIVVTESQTEGVEQRPKPGVEHRWDKPPKGPDHPKPVHCQPIRTFDTRYRRERGHPRRTHILIIPISAAIHYSLHNGFFKKDKQPKVAFTTKIRFRYGYCTMGIRNEVQTMVLETENLIPPPGLSFTPKACKVCGGCLWQEVLRERISDQQTVARYRCERCQAEHLRFIRATDAADRLRAC